MKNRMKMSAVVTMVILASQSSFAQVNNVEDPEFQQNKLEAMAAPGLANDMMADIRDLREKLYKAVTSASESNPGYGNARALGRVEEVEAEAASLLASRSDVSIHGRTREEIRTEIRDIVQSYERAGGIQ